MHREAGRILFSRTLSRPLAEKVEESLYQHLSEGIPENQPRFWELYETRVCHLVDTLRRPLPDGNPALLGKLEEGTLDPARFVQMTGFERLPDRWSALDQRAQEQKELRENFKNRLTTTDLYCCRRCKQRRCVTMMIQKRSADEPMSTHVMCVECGNEWFEN